MDNDEMSGPRMLCYVAHFIMVMFVCMPGVAIGFVAYFIRRGIEIGFNIGEEFDNEQKKS